MWLVISDWFVSDSFMSIVWFNELKIFQYDMWFMQTMHRKSILFRVGFRICLLETFYLFWSSHRILEIDVFIYTIQGHMSLADFAKLIKSILLSEWVKELNLVFLTIRPDLLKSSTIP